MARVDARPPPEAPVIPTRSVSIPVQQSSTNLETIRSARLRWTDLATERRTAGMFTARIQSNDQALPSRLGPQANLGRRTRMLRRQLLDRCDVVLQPPAHGVGLAVPRGVEGFGTERRACVVQSHHLRPAMNRVKSQAQSLFRSQLHPSQLHPGRQRYGESSQEQAASAQTFARAEELCWFNAQRSRARPAPGRPSRRACGSTDP